MKKINRASSILRITGIVLIILAVVFCLYSMANTGSFWKALNSRMALDGVSTNFIDRVRFDDDYFTALSQAAASKQSEPDARMALVRARFSRYFDRLRDAERKTTDARSEEVYTWFENEFDAQAFLDNFATLENLQESQELKEIFEFIDGLNAAPKKGKLASLKTTSQEPWFTEYYATFSAEQGEEAGSWYEFMSTVTDLLHEDQDAGVNVRDVKAWMSNNFTVDRYMERLPQVRSREQSELKDNFYEGLARVCEQKLAGESTDFRGFLDTTADSVEAKYPNLSLGGHAAFLSCIRGLMEDPAFDGSYSMISGAMKQAAETAAQNGVAAFEDTYCTGIMTEADNRASIGLVSIFWALVAKYLLILVIGILLVVLAKVIHYALSKRLLAQRQKAGIEEQDDVLLRVEHLKQYFRSGTYINKAVDDISFFIKKGEVFGLVGESGCGKTTTGRTIINLYDPTEGDVYFEGLRISSTQNGLPVLRQSLRNDCQEKIARLESEMKEQISQHPSDAARLRSEFETKRKELKKELRERLRSAEDKALESSVEKSKATDLYHEKRKAELTAEYEKDIAGLSGAALEARKREYETEMKVAAKDNIMTQMQMIFQDPIASINPRMTVREIIAEGLVIRGVTDKEYIDKKVYEMLELVGLVPEHADRYPHEFSGGQRQRIGIARAIIMEPDLIIADEPISALDVSIQAQVINLLNDLRNRMGLTIMFIAHNLSVVKYFSDRIAVMYFGKIVEMTTSDELFAHPLHPYTKSLLSAIPYPDPHYEKMRKRVEYVPEKVHDYSKDKPSLREITPGHYIHCNDAEFAQYKKELGL